MNICTVRGILIGSRPQFEQINRAIVANEIHPVVDEKVFELSQVREAYGYMRDQKHLGSCASKSRGKIESLGRWPGRANLVVLNRVKDGANEIKLATIKVSWCVASITYM